MRKVIMLKHKIVIFVLLVLPFNLFASHYVNGYTRSNGTYVAGHMSDDPGEGVYRHWHYNVPFRQSNRAIDLRYGAHSGEILVAQLQLFDFS